MGLLAGGQDLEALLRAYRRLSLLPRDGWIVRAGHQAAARQEAEGLRQAAADELASQPAETQRRARLVVGHNLLRAASAIAQDAERASLRRIATALEEKSPRATVFGAVAWALGAGAEEAVDAHSFAVLAGMVAAAVRLGVVGPLEGQAVLRRTLTSGQPAPPGDDWTSFSPVLDIAAMRHELLEPRLFAS